MDLTPGQRALVEHGSGPARLIGGFGSGKSVALAARAARLQEIGRRPRLVGTRDLVGVAVEVLRRHGRDVALIDDTARLALVSSLVEPSDAPVAEVAAAIAGFEASFLGDEELRVHADAAGCLARAEVLIDVTARYLAALTAEGLIDTSGAVIEASLLLRDPGVLAAERDRFDDLLIDDFQLATFAQARLIGQLAGRDRDVVVVGNAEAAVSSAPLASSSHLGHFVRRFDAGTDIELSDAFRTPTVDVVDVVADDAGFSNTATVLSKDDAEAAVGREWAHVVVAGVTEGAWPAPRPRSDWFDVELFHGPDVPDDAERDRRWLDLERRRFAVATSRATHSLTIATGPNLSPFVGDRPR